MDRGNNGTNKTGPGPSRGVKQVKDSDWQRRDVKAKQESDDVHDSQDMGLSSSKNSLQKVEDDKKKFSEMKLEEKRKQYKCGNTGYKELCDIPTWQAYSLDNLKHSPVSAKERQYAVNEELNKKISLFVGDITTLEIDAIVNAANETLLGGGGVDGAIHSAAGTYLKEECRLLKGCNTGEAKITCGYKLPAKYVIHTVGPIGEHEVMLKSAYQSCLDLVKKHKLKSVAFPCISTGIYGYPVKKATHVALETIRNWLEENHSKVERIILCVFLDKDVKVYENMLQNYFPLLPKTSESGEAEDDDEEREKPVIGIKKGTQPGHQHSQDHEPSNPQKRAPASEAAKSKAPTTANPSSDAPQMDDRRGNMCDKNKNTSAAASSKQESKRKKEESKSGDPNRETTEGAVTHADVETIGTLNEWASAAENNSPEKRGEGQNNSPEKRGEGQNNSPEKRGEGQKKHARKEKQDKSDEVKKEKRD